MNKELIKRFIPFKIIELCRKLVIGFGVKYYSFKYPNLIVRKNTTDGNILCQIFLFKEHKIPFKINPKIIIDAGAYVGYSALYFSSKYPNAKIISIEPEEENFKILKDNTKDVPNIIAIRAGLSNQKGFLNVIDNNTGAWGFSTEQTKTKTKNSIRAITIDEILDEYGFDLIDLIKIDIEGDEKKLFLNNHKWLDKVKILTIELHGFLSGKSDCGDNFYSAIENYNFSKIHQERGEMLVRDTKAFDSSLVNWIRNGLTMEDLKNSISEAKE